VKSLTTASITAVLLAFAAQPALADDDDGSRYVSYQTLLEYCAKAKADSRGPATLLGRDGKPVTGIVHCETDYEFYAANRGYDDDHSRNRGGDDDWDDDGRHDD
jgi:hypothetical protein